MKNQKSSNRGITLISLIITIIVLLILAGVAIATLTGDSGILSNAEKAKKETLLAKSEEQVSLAVASAMTYTDSLGKVKKANLETELNRLIGEGKYSIKEEAESWIVTVTDTGYTTTIRETGNMQEIIKVTQITIVEENLELDEGKEGQLTVTVNPSNSNEGLSYISSNTAVAMVDDAGKVTAVAEGTATITVQGNVSTTVKDVIEVTVTKPAVPAIGDYVTYNVSYTDIYTGYEFTTSNGWRILDIGTPNVDGTYSNVKLISTGIPVELNYQYANNAGNSVNGWWGTDSQVETLYGSKYAIGYSYYPARYAATGLKENFESIPFIAGASISVNQGGFKKINSTNTGSVTGSIFKATGASKVHNLTLEELNTARRLEANSLTSTATTDGDTGLFYLRNLETENSSFGYSTSTELKYWLSSPHTDFTGRLGTVFSDGTIGYQDYVRTWASCCSFSIIKNQKRLIRKLGNSTVE